MKRLLPVLAALLFLACGSRESRPNVVLITMDTTRADYLSCYGYPAQPSTTPNLDELAQDGTRFDLTMATAAVTPVSHASILTGRFNRDHGLRVIYAGSGFRLPDDVPTLSTEFKAAGYQTIAVHSAFPVAPYFGFGRGFDVVRSFLSEMATDDRGSARWDQRLIRRSDETMRIVFEELEETSEPFFLWIHLWDPHDPIQVPPADQLPPDHELYVLDEEGEIIRNSLGNPKMLRPPRALYAAEIRYMDSQLGRFFESLVESGLWENTLVAVTSDHGEGLSDHSWASHRILYQEQIRVPLILRLPGIQQKKVVGELTRTVDIAPTLLDYAGVPLPDGMGGRSLRALIEDRQDEARLTFAEQINGYDLNAHLVKKRPQDDFTYMAMDRRWKLTWRPNHPGASELYDIAADPKELQNLWDWSHPEAVRLKRELGSHAPWVSAPFPQAALGASAESAARALAALGYAGGSDGAGAGPEWEYVCPVHYQERGDRQGGCPDCESRMILIGKGK